MLAKVLGGRRRVKETVKSDSKGEWSAGQVIVAIIVVVIIAGAFYFFWPKGEVSTYQGTLSVTIHNDALFDRVPYTLYIDGSLIQSSSVGPLDTVSLSFTVNWTGTHSTHTFALNVVTSNHTQDFSVSIKDGGVGSVPITI